MGKGVHITLADVPPGPVEPRSVCKNRSVTFPPEAGAQLWQPLQHGREDWRRICFRLRNSVEGVNGFGKDPLFKTKPLGDWTPKGCLTKTDNNTETEPDQ
ncbi:hypothetical protein [Streptomyces sp. MAI_2237]